MTVDHKRAFANASSKLSVPTLDLSDLEALTAPWKEHA